MNTASNGKPILNVRNLTVRYHTPVAMIDAVRGVSFSVGSERLGIVGESGSGKSTVGRAILGLLPRRAQVEADTLTFEDEALLDASEKRMLQIRGRRISMILQDPKYSLNPVIRVGDQISEAYRVHHKVSKTEARERALDMLQAVRINDPRRVYGLYPHEVSGGMGQRIMIAMMLIPEPRLLIADEPTSALDVTVRLQVLSILDELVSERGVGLIFVTHDLNLARTFCDRLLIMYAGRIVEEIRAEDLDRAQHAYTHGLLNSLPKLEKRGAKLPVLVRDPAWLE